MSEHIKKRIIKALIEEITDLGAKEIELVGHNYISLREKKSMIHHGLNKDYMPSGYTVDSFSDDSSIIGEYSAEKGYFDYSGKKESPIYSKVSKDINHALKHKSNIAPEKIYLISNQEENASFRAKFNSTPIGIEHCDRLIIIDARELAKGVYKQSIQNSNAADFYKQYFPTFSQYLDNYEYFGKLPNVCDEYIYEGGIINAISNHFISGNNVCVLHGVSGSGKTQSVIDFVKQNKDIFPNYIWIGGEDWSPNSTLCSVQRSRGGAPVNVAGLFNSEKSILIIDNYVKGLEKSYFEELSVGFEKGGVVLITSQISVPNNSMYLSIPQFSIDNSLNLLGESASSASELCMEFISRCRFSPLILSVTQKLCNEQGINKEVIYKEILDEPELVDDSAGVSIVKKILSGLRESSFNALKAIANSGKNYHDIEFLRHFIGSLNCNTLQKLSLLVPENTTGVHRIHDLISLAVQDKIDSSFIVASIESFISKKNGDMTPSVLRQIHLCTDLITEVHVRRGTRDIDWLHYSFMQLEGGKKLDLYKELHVLAVSEEDSLQKVMSVIDAKEVYSYTILDKTIREEYYSSCVVQYDELLNKSISGEVNLELLHHKGKALRRLSRSSEALDSFNQLLTLQPEWHATYGQIAHLGAQYGVEKCVKEAGDKAIRTLVEFIKNDIFSVPLRVSLAALSKLRSYKNFVKEINEQPELVKKLAEVISISSLEGLDQFYEAFVSFTSMFRYKHSFICVNIAESIPELIVILPKQVKQEHWVSACEALTNSSVASEKENKTKLSKQLIKSALFFASEISNLDQISSYNARCAAKAFTIGNEAESAINTINKVPKERVNFWLLYEKSEAYIKLKKYDSALSSAKECFDLAIEKNAAKDAISAYHDLLSTCYEKLDDKDNAIKELLEAIIKSSDEKYKSELEARLANLTKC